MNNAHRSHVVVTPAQRRERIVAILARGLLRLHRAAIAAGTATEQKSFESPPIRLDLARESRPHVPAG